MGRWSAGWGLALASSFAVLLHHSTSVRLLEDSDTSVLLRTIAAKDAPFSWFGSDWPLYNHFYRPIPTLLFELDLRLYHNSPAGYGWTNASLCAGCVLALFWLLREMTDRVPMALVGLAVFTGWQLGIDLNPLSWLSWLAVLVIAVGALRHRRSWKTYLSAGVSILFLETLLNPVQSLRFRTLEWLPGRTATCMTLFALIALAAYARLERTRFRLPVAKPTPLDLPSTKSSRVQGSSRLEQVILFITTLSASSLAFASYEQAVMLPACLLGVAVFFRLCKARPLWWVQAPVWSELVAYLWLRHRLIPPGTSHYQAQQLRTSFGGAWMSFLDVAYPLLNTVPVLVSRVQMEGMYLFVSDGIYVQGFWAAVILTGTYQLRREWKLALAGWLLGVIAFLPMAFLKLFEHYYYWPLALQTILVAAAAKVAFDLSITALSPPAIQAPARLAPAPGSLLRP